MNIDKDELNKYISKSQHEQYGAALEMFESVIKSCPVELWDDKSMEPPFWHVVYHTWFFVDLYLASPKEKREAFKARYEETPPGFEQISEEVLPQDQLIKYLLEIRKKVKGRLENIGVDVLIQPSIFEWHGNSVLSPLIYNIRHLMLHIGSLNSRILRMGINLDNWVSKALIIDSE